jgi:hypothetical protein
MEDKARAVFGDKSITIQDTTTRTIKGALLTHPDIITMMTGFGRLEKWRAKTDDKIRDMIDMNRVMMRRVPTQEEVDAIVEHGSRYTYKSRLGIPLGAAGWAAWMGWDLKRNGLLAPLARNSQDMHGVVAALKEMKHMVVSQSGVAWRLALNGGLRALLVIPVMWSLSDSIATLGRHAAMLGDSRLEETTRVLRELNPERLHNLNMEVSQEIRNRRIRDAVQRAREQKQERGADTAAVQEQTFSESNGQDQSPVSMESSYAQSEGMNGDKAPTQPDRKPYEPPLEPKGRDQGPVDFFDDASPIAPDNKNDTSNHPVGGSAWERVRQQSAAPGANPRARQENFWQGRAQLEERNKPSDYASEKEQEREKARAEFEKLLESERNMSTESPGNGSKGGWGSW